MRTLFFCEHTFSLWAHIFLCVQELGTVFFKWSRIGHSFFYVSKNWTQYFLCGQELDTVFFMWARTEHRFFLSARIDHIFVVDKSWTQFLNVITDSPKPESAARRWVGENRWTCRTSTRSKRSIWSTLGRRSWSTLGRRLRWDDRVSGDGRQGHDVYFIAWTVLLENYNFICIGAELLNVSQIHGRTFLVFRFLKILEEGMNRENKNVQKYGSQQNEHGNSGCSSSHFWRSATTWNLSMMAL